MSAMDTSLPRDADGDKIQVLGNHGPNQGGGGTQNFHKASITHNTPYEITDSSNWNRDLVPGKVYEIRIAPENSSDVLYYRWSASGGTAPAATSSDAFWPIGVAGVWPFKVLGGQEQLDIMYVASSGSGSVPMCIVELS